MSILGQVGKAQRRHIGQRIVFAAQEKLGKTTLAMGAPGALLIPLEVDNVALAKHHTNHVPPSAVPTWVEVLKLCEELRTAAMRGQLRPGSTLVWDSGTALERYIHAYVINTSPEAEAARKAGFKELPKNLNMETAHGGFGKAYQQANIEFDRWLRYQDELATMGGINIVVTCHVFPSRVVDPAHGEFDTWDLLLHSPKNNKSYGKREMITQWADLIGFLHEPLFVGSSEKGSTLVKAVSANQGRVLAVERSPAWVAGNRFGLRGTVPIPEQGGWNALAHAVYDATGKNVDLFNRA